MQLQRSTKHTKPTDRIERWHVIDAEGERLGRLASKIAGLLQGKHRPDFSRHQLSEDFVIVVNAAKVGFSGNKLSQKVYYRHSGYMGGMRTRTLEEMLGRFPERVIELAVKGMLPRNRLGRRMLRRMKVYASGEHPHEAQVRMGMAKPKQAPAALATSSAPDVQTDAAAEAEPVVAVAETAIVQEETAAIPEQPETAVEEPLNETSDATEESASEDDAAPEDEANEPAEEGDGERK